MGLNRLTARTCHDCASLYPVFDANWFPALTACSQSAPPAPANADLTTAPPLPTAALFRGQLSRLSNGEAAFTPCSSKQQWRFNADPAFWQRWQQMGNPTELYAELEGTLALSTQRGGAIELTLQRVDH